MSGRQCRIAILGSTGSIGRQTLEVVRWHPDRFVVVGLAAGGFSDLFRAQLEEFGPRWAAVGREDAELPVAAPRGLLRGPAGLAELATVPEVDLVVVATVGHVGLVPTLAALSAGKRVALANKEALVMAGKLVVSTAARSGARILPVDSEHSAIWQCLRGEGELSQWPTTVRSLLLTASGGALRDLPGSELDEVCPAQVLAHPTWNMGPKVTVDSATLMNKGLEVMEARWLFGLPLDRIKVLIHRESIVHSLVEFVDGSVKAQLGTADMRVPIQYALSFPERLPSRAEPLDLARVGRLTFEEIDLGRYPCLGLAREAAEKDLSYPAVLSAANEVAVDLFLRGEVSFGDIPALVREVLARHRPVEIDSYEAARAVDEWGRRECLLLAQDRKRN